MPWLFGGDPRKQGSKIYPMSVFSCQCVARNAEIHPWGHSNGRLIVTEENRWLVPLKIGKGRGDHPWDADLVGSRVYCSIYDNAEMKKGSLATHIPALRLLRVAAA
jgi:hypothetical protein